jgi:predicted dehydrogenase
MIRIGLIGAGGMGGVHSAIHERLAESCDCRIVAVADLDREKAERIAVRSGARTFDSGLELIASAEVDIVDICLPTDLHALHAVKAMEKGLHVFVEKPVCLNEDEARWMLETKLRIGVHIAVGHCIRFWEEYVYLKRLIDECTYGKLRFASFQRLSPPPSPGSWFHDEARSGSAVLDLHIHDVDFVRHVLGQPLEVRCMMRPGPNGREHVLSLYRYPDSMVSLEGGWDHSSGFPFEMGYRVIFEQATVVYSSLGAPTLHVYREDGTTEVPELPKPEGGHFNEIRYFLECLAQGQYPDVLALEESVESARLVWREIAAAR